MVVGVLFLRSRLLKRYLAVATSEAGHNWVAVINELKRHLFLIKKASATESQLMHNLMILICAPTFIEVFFIYFLF